MEIRYRNEPRDLKLMWRTLPWFDQLMVRGLDLWCCVFIGVLPGAVWLSLNGSWAALARGLAAATFLAGLLMFLTRRATRKGHEKLKEVALRLEPGWLEAQTETSWSRRRWESVRSVTVVPGGIVICIDNWMWHIVPDRAFAEQSQAQQFAALATRCMEEAGQNPAAIQLPLPSWFQPPPFLAQIKYQPKQAELLRIYRGGGTISSRSQGSNPKSQRSGCGMVVTLVLLVFILLILRTLRTRPAATPQLLLPEILYWASCVVLWVFGLYFLQRMRARRAVRNQNLDEEVLTLTLVGCLLQSSIRLSFLHWKDVTAILQDEHVILFKLQAHVFHVIPNRAFASVAEAEEFFQRSHEYWSNIQANSAESVPVTAYVVESSNPYESPRHS